MLNGNPAARLLEIILEAKDANKNANTLIVWEKILKSENNLALTHERLAKVIKLSEETCETVKSLFPRQIRPTDAWKNALDQAFAGQNMLANFNSFIDYIDNTAIDHLTAAVDLLESKQPTILSAEEIEDYTKKINELIAEILNSSLEEKVKEYMVRSLRKIVIALEEYRLAGSIPITNSIEQILGHGFFDKDYANALSNTKEGSKLMSILGGLADAVTVATPIVQMLLPESIRKLLGTST
ncbi:hypothetical protein [Pseudomonas sp. S3E17]|uniref:hypothetical protein n=1 Tax=Pseudomonas sp. S3E17 TaxID=2817893 RepID=UPI00209EFF0A|nr:hypothetical protein [Pseudomonas sp. S3E17]MCP1466580.1 hypothetical protein [Pseudomonas sp. S3E17]